MAEGLSGTDTAALAAETAGQLRAVLAAVDAGTLEAEPWQRAYLAGAAEALDKLSRTKGKDSGA